MSPAQKAVAFGLFFFGTAALMVFVIGGVRMLANTHPENRYAQGIDKLVGTGEIGGD